MFNEKTNRNNNFSINTNFNQMKNTFMLIAAWLFTTFAMTGCGNQGADKLKGFNTTKSGLKYKFYEKNDTGRMAKEGDWITVDMIYRTNDSVLFDSKNLPNPMDLPLMKSVHQGDIYEGMSMMHVGDSATFACNADSVMIKLFKFKKGSYPHGMDSLTYIFFDIKLKKVQTKEEKLAADEAARKKAQEEAIKAMNEEPKIIEDYIKENNITVKPTKSGLYVIVEKEGAGPKPKKGSMVKVDYTGYLLDGTKFDSSKDRGQPFEFQLGAGRVIAGWDEGIGMLRVGSKAKLIIPSSLAYGERGAGNLIKPYTPLVFEVELLDSNPK